MLSQRPVLTFFAGSASQQLDQRFRSRPLCYREGRLDTRRRALLEQQLQQFFVDGDAGGLKSDPVVLARQQLTQALERGDRGIVPPLRTPMAPRSELRA